MCRCYIIDDESHAIQLLTGYVGQTPGLNLIGSSVDPISGLHAVLANKPDVLFLDVDMPKMSGLDLYNGLDKNIKVIFTTAHPNYAVEAFDLAAADFLLKPIRYSRFLKSVSKIMDTPKGLQAGPVSDFFFIQSSIKAKMFRINFDDVSYIESFNNYLVIHLRSEQHIVYMSLRELLEKLPDTKFCRIHKSYIINFSKIRAVEGNRVFLSDIPELPIGSQYKVAFFKLIQSNFLQKK